MGTSKKGQIQTHLFMSIDSPREIFGLLLSLLNSAVHILLAVYNCQLGQTLGQGLTQMVRDKEA